MSGDLAVEPRPLDSGQYTDPETGLQYLRARYYDPSTGQLLSADPVASMTRDRYGYAARSPLRFSDPSGRCFASFCDDWGDDATQAWDNTGGRIVSAVSDHRDGLLQLGAAVLVGACAVATDGICLEAAVAVDEATTAATSAVAGWGALEWGAVAALTPPAVYLGFSVWGAGYTVYSAVTGNNCPDSINGRITTAGAVGLNDSSGQSNNPLPPSGGANKSAPPEFNPADPLGIN